MKNLTDVPESERRPMTKAESELFIALTLSAPEELSKPVAGRIALTAALETLFKPAFTDDLVTAILLQRLGLTDEEYDPRVVAMAAFLADRPGFAVLWAYTLYQRTKQLGRPYTFDNLVADFPNGFPTSDGAAKIWDGQKGWAQEPTQKVDNMLDQPEAWGRRSQKEAVA